MTAFDAVLLLIALIDIVFLALRLARYQVRINGIQSNLAIAFTTRVAGIVFACSLMSDLLTLALTIERYVALTAPVYYHGIPKENTKGLWLIAGVVAIFLS